MHNIRNKFSGSLYGAMAMITILPMAILGVVVSIFCVIQYTNAIYGEVQLELENVCNLTLVGLDEFYPGDYTYAEAENVLYKGEKALDDRCQILDRIKAETGIELTLFYRDTRMMTTIIDENGTRNIGTKCREDVLQEVYEEGMSKFYKQVEIMQHSYFSYYVPVYNADGNRVGMLFAGKLSKQITSTVAHFLLLDVLVISCTLIVVGYICFRWTDKMIMHIQIIQSFLSEMSEGKFSEEMDSIIIKRNDEFGKMGNSIVQMQRSIRNLVERDALTGLYNRRFGIAKLDETQKSARIDGMPFTVALGDIDFFKKVNDTYGHDCGDLVLKKTASLLMNHMREKGFAVRWGGEEFLLVYTKLNMEETLQCLEQLMQEIRAMRVPYGDSIVRLTMSFGVTEGDVNQKENVFIKVADDKLYYGKRNGRNQVVSRLPEEGEENGVEHTSM